MAPRSAVHHPISIERLERALSIAALAVALDGDVYLPIFKRMEDEVRKAHETCDARNRAHDLAANYAPAGKIRAMR